MRRSVLLTLAALVVGCGLVSGLDGLHVDADASFEGGSEGGLSCEAGCGNALPPGFSAIVTFATALPATCPGGTNAQPVVADPTVAQTACSCQCAVSSKGACTATTVQLLVGDGGLSSCTNAYTTLNATPGCHLAEPPFTLASSTRVDNNNAGTVSDAGICGNTAIADASTLATTPAQLCVPTTCEAANALCTPPSGQVVCIAGAGDVACPAPFTQKHLVGNAASVACSACGSSCTFGNESCNGHLSLYTDPSCTVGLRSASSCTSVGAAMTVGSYEYTTTIAGSTCTTTATSSPTTSLDAEQTVCCHP